MVVTGLLLQINVIDAHHFAPMDINDLLIKQVTLEQKQSFSPVGFWPLPRRSGGIDTAVDRPYGSKWQHPVAGLSFYNEIRNPGWVFLRIQSHFSHTSALFSR